MTGLNPGFAATLMQAGVTNPTDFVAYKQQKFICHTSETWEVAEQGR